MSYINATACAPSSLEDRLEALSVIVPLRNEEDHVESIVRDLREIVPQVSARMEILLVDDGSSDRTPEICARLERAFSEVRVLTRRSDHGYGAALGAGCKAANSPWIFWLDGDEQFDVSDLIPLSQPVREGNFDAAVGVRARRGDPLLRRLLGRAWTVMVQRAIGVELTDMNCAFKLLPRTVFDGWTPSSRGAAFTAEVMQRVQLRGLRLAEVPVRHYPRESGEQSGANPRVMAKAMIELGLLAARSRRGT